MKVNEAEVTQHFILLMLSHVCRLPSWLSPGSPVNAESLHTMSSNSAPQNAQPDTFCKAAFNTGLIVQSDDKIKFIINSHHL